MHSVEFVLNDDVQLRFDGAADAEGAVTLTSFVWPIVEVDGRSWSEHRRGYADVLRRLTPGVAPRRTGGDERALAELYELHVDRVFRHAARLAGDRRDAEDATAVAFFELWRKRHRVRLVDGSPLPWLLATTTHALRNLTRASARYRKLLDVIPRTDTTRSVGEEIADQSAVQEMLAPLGRIEQQLVVLSVFEGFTSSEAGAAVGLSAGAARTRLTRARARIRAHLTTSDATREETA